MNRLAKKTLTTLTLLIGTSILVACDCSTPLEITAIQKSDKKLACKDIILEINEAEHYRGEAAESKKITFGKLFMPTCWVSGYVNGQQAMKTADARIDYLGHIYDLLDCGGMQSGYDEDGAELPALKQPLRRPKPMSAVPQNEANPFPGQAYPPQLQKDEKGVQYKPLMLPAK